MLKKIAFATLAITAACVAPSSAAVLAEWTFETSVPVTGGPHVAEGGVFAATSNASSNTGATFSNPAGFGSIESFSSNGWNAGEYFQFSAPSTGYEDITLSLAATGSNTGPRDFEVRYSTDGSSFTTLTTYTLTNDAWNAIITPAASLKGSFAAPSTLDDQALVYFRLAAVGTTSITGGTVATTGTSRVDNVTINGTVIPEPASLGLIALGGLALLRRRRSTVA